MTPHDFIRKWRDVELKERTASQSHFNDLCALLGVLDPVSASACAIAGTRRTRSRISSTGWCSACSPPRQRDKVDTVSPACNPPPRREIARVWGSNPNLGVA